MPRAIFRLLPLVPFLFFAALPLTAQEGTLKAELVGIEVQNALKVAASQNLGGLKLKKAIITLETGFSQDTGGSLNLVIFTIKYGEKKGRTFQTKITLEQFPTPAGVAPAEELKEALRAAITQAGRVASNISVLRLSEAVFTIEFAVEKKGGGGVEFTILGAKIGGTVDLEKTSRNSLEVTFTR